MPNLCQICANWRRLDGVGKRPYKAHGYRSLHNLERLMATIENRSPYQVTVKNCDDLTKKFSFNKLPGVEAYMATLRQQQRATW